MGKRSNFVRKHRDFYKTPEKAVLPLLNHLEPETVFAELCAGDGQLVDILEKYGHKCVIKSDIEPQRNDIDKLDILTLQKGEIPIILITNPAWDRKILHPIIEKIIDKSIYKAWLLFDADWMHTKQSSEYIKYCHKIVSIGRVRWFPDTKMTDKDNCAWYLFKSGKASKTEFVGREKLNA